MIYKTDREFKQAIEERLDKVISNRAWEVVGGFLAECGYHTPLDDKDIEGCIEILKKVSKLNE